MHWPIGRLARLPLSLRLIYCGARLLKDLKVATNDCAVWTRNLDLKMQFLPDNQNITGYLFVFFLAQIVCFIQDALFELIHLLSSSKWITSHIAKHAHNGVRNVCFETCVNHWNKFDNEACNCATILGLIHNARIFYAVTQPILDRAQLSRKLC